MFNLRFGGYTTTDGEDYVNAGLLIVTNASVSSRAVTDVHTAHFFAGTWTDVGT